MGLKRPAEEPPMDFRCPENDAWYGVRLKLEDGEELRVMYKDFDDAFDERYKADGFETFAEVDQFRARFRTTSVQLQDEECRKAIEGMEVCVAHHFDEDDVRFYDAVIESVDINHQSWEKESCTCSFKVLWTHGPLAGETTLKSVGDLCLLQPKCTQNPILNNFLDMAWRRIETRSAPMGPSTSGLPLIQGDATESVHCHSNKMPAVDSCSRTIEATSTHAGPRTSGLPLMCQNNGMPAVDSCSRNPQLAGDEDPKSTRNKKDTCRVRCFDQRMPTKSKDLQGESLRNICSEESYYVIWIENLEKDLSPFTVMDFLYEKACTSALVFCSRWVSDMLFRGAIYVKTKEEADQLLDFLLSSAHIVVSSKGRPWVICKKCCGATEYAVPKYEKSDRRKNAEHSRELSLVYQGTEEYKKADQLRKLHLEFHNHIHGLVQRLASEEKRIVPDR